MSHIVHDEPWFTRLTQASILDTHWLTVHTRVTTDERTRFLENEVENPVFEVTSDSSLDIARARTYWRDFLTDLANNEQNEVVLDLYSQKIKAQVWRIDMLEAIQNGDDCGFMEASVAIYGKPKKRYFNYVASQMQCLVAATQNSPHRNAVRRLERIFKKLDTSSNHISHDILPVPADFSERLEDPRVVAKIFTDVLKAYDIVGWEIVVDESLRRRVFSVSQKHRVIHIPASEHLRSRKRPLTRTGVTALAEHEIGTHIVRHERGMKQSLQLLGIGLRGYLRGEEGIATYRQQRIEGADEYYGFDRYLAACLVCGLDGHARDFRELFVVMRDYYLLTLTQSDEVFDRAQEAAWDVCLRLFRGTTGQQAGYCFTRDINYLEGNIGIWKLLTDQPEWNDYVSLGKYDPLNQSHVEALRALEILEI